MQVKRQSGEKKQKKTTEKKTLKKAKNDMNRHYQ